MTPLQSCLPQSSTMSGLAPASGGGQEPGQHRGLCPQEPPSTVVHSTCQPPMLCFREGRQHLSTALGELQQA